MNPSSDAVQRFCLPSPTRQASDASARLALILLVEDNPGDAHLVMSALEEHGVFCEVILIGDGERAVAFIQDLEMADARCPDLVILDLNLPRVPGYDVLRRMRASARCGHVPVAILTSSTDRKDRESAAQLGANRYLSKPLHLAEFIALGATFKEMLGS